MGIRRTVRDVAVEVGIRQRHSLRVGELEGLEQGTRRRLRFDVRVPVAVVVLEPLPRRLRAPGVDVGV